jgi:hypothetical protein
VLAFDGFKHSVVRRWSYGTREYRNAFLQQWPLVQYSGSSSELTGSSGLNSTSSCLLGGADAAVRELAHVGVETGLDRINSSDHNGGYGQVGNVHGGIYAFAKAGPLVVSGMIDVKHTGAIVCIARPVSAMPRPIPMATLRLPRCRSHGRSW